MRKIKFRVWDKGKNKLYQNVFLTLIVNDKGESATTSNTVGEFEETNKKAEDRVFTKEPMGAAWMSARNIRATDKENSDLNKARTLFFENPSIDMSAYEVRLEVDYDYLNTTLELKELA